MTQSGIRQHPPEWVRHLSKPELTSLFGDLTVLRGIAYQRKGSVVALAYRTDGRTIAANVLGTRRYTTLVTLREAQPSHSNPIDHLDLVSTCTCPLGGGCKHAVALILEAQKQATNTPHLPAVSPWESVLAPVVREVTASKPAHTPLALLVEVNPGASAYRQRPHLQLRPLAWGASGAWIRTGASWTDIQHSYQWRDFEPAQQEALASIILAANARTPYYYGNGQSVTSEALGNSVWSLLQNALTAGVTLVTGKKADRPVALLPDPAELVVDTRRVESAGDLLVHPLIRVPGILGEPVTLGNPAHGVYIDDGYTLTLAALREPLSPTMFELLESVDSLTIPARDADRFLTQYYPALRQQANVESSDDSVMFPEVHPPRLGLRVTFADGHRTLLQWSFRYTVGTETITVPLLRSATPDPVARDAAVEEALLASLEILDTVAGLTTRLPGKTRPGVILEPTLEGWSTIAFIREMLPVLQAREDIDITVVGSPLDYLEVDAAPVVSVATRDIAGAPEHEDWFDLEILVTVSERDVPLVTLLSALAMGEERLLLEDGAWFSLDRPELQTLRRVVEEARAMQDRESDPLRINRYQAGLWEELVDLGVVAEQSQRWASSVSALLTLEEVPHPQPPTSLTATLRPYQLDGYQWLSFLWDQKLGGILADDMGLGKTLQMLSTAERARLEGSLTPDAPMLVVAPTSVVSTWHREAETFTPQMSVATITQTTRKSGVPLKEAVAGAHVVVTSYALLRLDAESYGDLDWSALVLDEAQFVKNHQSRTHQVARSLRAPVKIAITGTPLENSLMDLWALLSITAPGLFPSPQRFGELFRKPIESGTSPDLLATLRRRIRPLMLRRTKEAVAQDLPPKIEQVVAVPLNPAHRRIYDTHLQRERQRILGLLDDVDRNRVAILSALTQLRQLSLDVHLVDPDAPTSVHSSKVDALIEQLVEVVAEGHRCLVFSQFTRFLAIVRQRLDAEGIGHVYLDGRTRNRPKRIAEFTDGDAPVFLISLKAGGSGLTLTQADYVFVLDPWWNPAVEAQAIDRTHRIGQDKTVMVYRLVSENTIEEKVVALQERKRELFSRVVDEGGLMGAPLTADDIRGLIEG